MLSKTTDEYVSSYDPEHGKVKFFGYLAIFEDYFIHSHLYDETVSEADMRSGKGEPVSGFDDHTLGCVIVAQEHLDWLTENVKVGTMVMESPAVRCRGRGGDDHSLRGNEGNYLSFVLAMVR